MSLNFSKKLFLEANSRQIFTYAENLSGAYGLEITTKAPVDICLCLTEKGLCLRNFAEKMPDLWFDFTQPKLLHRLDAKRVEHEILLKAVKLKNQPINLIVDATLGIGIDAILLTNICERLIGFEQNFYIFLLLTDAIYRAKNANLLSANLEKLELRWANSSLELPNLPEKPEIIYLDPMFEDLSTKSQARKNINFMRKILKSNSADLIKNSQQLLERSLDVALKKVVVKRQVRATQDKRTTYQIKGKNIRFDVYFTG